MVTTSSRQLRLPRSLVAWIGPATAQSLTTLVEFQCSTVGCAPNGRLLQARDGFFYGDGQRGRLSVAGRRHSLPHGSDWSNHRAALARSILHRGSRRVLLRHDSGWRPGWQRHRLPDRSNRNVTELYAFDGTTAWAPGPLVQTVDGLFYGIVSMPGTDDTRSSASTTPAISTCCGPTARQSKTSGCCSPPATVSCTHHVHGRVFRLNRNGQARILAVFPTVYVDLMEASDGSFYEPTIDGGASGRGTIFRMTHAGKIEVLHGSGEVRSMVRTLTKRRSRGGMATCTGTTGLRRRGVSTRALCIESIQFPATSRSSILSATRPMPVPAPLVSWSRATMALCTARRRSGGPSTTGQLPPTARRRGSLAERIT